MKLNRNDVILACVGMNAATAGIAGFYAFGWFGAVIVASVCLITAANVGLQEKLNTLESERARERMVQQAMEDAVKDFRKGSKTTFPNRPVMDDKPRTFREVQ